MFCRHCGKDCGDVGNEGFCPYCGEPIGGGSPTATKPTDAANDASSFGFALLCFLIPLLGLILWLVWRNELPLRAKSCGKGAIISVIVSVAISILYVIIAAVIVGSTSSTPYYGYALLAL